MLVELAGISPDFMGSKLLDILSRAVVETKMNILPHDMDSAAGYMDITRYLSIRTVYGYPTETIELVKGLAL